MNLLNGFRTELSKVPYLNDVLDSIIARVNALWPVQHHLDGTHGDVTATSLTVDGGGITLATPDLGAHEAFGQMTGNLIPSASNTYSLGGQNNAAVTSPIYAWKDLYLVGTIYLSDVTSLVGGHFAPFTMSATTSVVTHAAINSTAQTWKWVNASATTVLTVGRVGLTSAPIANGLRATNIRSDGIVETDSLHLADGITAPSATAGVAKVYVDTADGDLKVIFGDGTVKTIVTD